MEQIKTVWPINGFMESRIGGRAENQDYLTSGDTSYGFIVIVCDGMGGGPAGRIASQNAAETILHEVKGYEGDLISKNELLEFAILKANERLLKMQDENLRLRGMGTTVTALLLDEECAYIAHVGDSRIYQLRFEQKHYRTFDHSQVMELVAQGKITEEEARTSPNSNVITRALGVINNPIVDTCVLPYEAKDRFVLCTDGAWGAMPEKDFVRLLAKPEQISGALEQTMIKVDEIGREEGFHHDNFSVAIIETKRNSKLKEQMTHETRRLFRLLSIGMGISISLNILFAICLFLNAGSEDQTQPRDLYRGSVSDSSMDKTLSELKEQNQIMKTTIEALQKQQSETIQRIEFIQQDTASGDNVKSKLKEFIGPEKSSIQSQQELLSIIDNLISLMSKYQERNDTQEISKDEISKLQELGVKLKEQLESMHSELASKLQQEVLVHLEEPICKKSTKNYSRSGQYGILISRLDNIKYRIMQ